jgi:transposase-like protein
VLFLLQLTREGRAIMAKKTTLNPLTDTPANKTQITKDFMLAYVRAKGTQKDKAWFKELAHNCVIEKVNKLNNKKGQGFDMKKMRDEFVLRFFPNLAANSSTVDAFLSEVDSL